MKRLKSILLASALLLTAPAFFTACQEDAPEINYTMNVSVINDFTKVVEAINNGTLKNEEALAKLTKAIDDMAVKEADKLQTITDVLTSTNATLTTLEAAMQAHTLAFKAKMELLETAMKNQTVKTEEMGKLIGKAIDESKESTAAKFDALIELIKENAGNTKEQLAAIAGAIGTQTTTVSAKLDLLEKAIKELPDYTKQFKAVSDALTTIGTQLKANADTLSGVSAQVKEANKKFGDLTTAIGGLTEQVKTGHENTAKVLGTVVANLDSLSKKIVENGKVQASVVEEMKKATGAIGTLKDEVKSGHANAATALASIAKMLEALKNKIGNGGGTPPTPPTPQPTDEYVDLGLPSGIKWAKCNLGASKPSDYGDYYAWGETAPKTNFTWDNYKWDGALHLTKYNDSDGKTVLDPEDDAATAKLGSPWRMPTIDEFQELIDHCAWKWTMQDGKIGYEVKSKTNGNAIFLPVPGYREGSELKNADNVGFYWSSSLYTNANTNSQELRFDMGIYHCRIGGRPYGCPIRPVHP